MIQDLRFAARMLLKQPGFTSIAVLTLSLGIGATSAVFSLVQGVLLTPPPYQQPDRLVLIHPSRKDGQRYTRGWPAAQWQEWQTTSKSFESIAAYGWTCNFLFLPTMLRSQIITSMPKSIIGCPPRRSRRGSKNRTVM